MIQKCIDKDREKHGEKRGIERSGDKMIELIDRFLQEDWLQDVQKLSKE